MIFQASLFYPIGTNGKEINVVNYSSLNLIYGKAAAFQGVEISGFGSRITDYGMGLQVAGFGNVVENYFKGSQISGFGNITGSSFEGLQVSGFGNITGSNLQGAQVAGFMNITGGYLRGFQTAGFMNITGGEFDGAQVAGFMNIAGGSSQGFQIAGFMNLNGSFDGLQIAPFNINGETRGMMIGVINMTGKMKGVPIGLISYVKDGYRAFDISGNESFYINASYKTGVSGFYNILTAGLRPGSGFTRFGLGWGVGSEIFLGKGAFMNIEATATQISEDEIWTSDLNLLNSVKFSFGANLTSGLVIYAGPSFNVLVSEYQNADGTIGSEIAPTWHFYNKTTNDTNVKMWAGFNLGLRFL